MIRVWVLPGVHQQPEAGQAASADQGSDLELRQLWLKGQGPDIRQGPGRNQKPLRKL